MSVYVLCDRVHHDISSVVQRVLYVRTQKRVVDDHFDAMPMRNCRDRSYVHQAQRGIARRLDPDQPRLARSNELLHV